MTKDSKNKALKYESEFEYGRGILRTPRNWISYFWNRYYEKIQPYFNGEIAKCTRIVFIGIGGGDIVPFLNQEDKRKIIGLDVNFKSLISAKEHVAVIMADGSAMPFKCGSVDMVVCNQVLHHMLGQGNLEATIDECYRILKKDGRFVAIEPNSLHPSGALMNMANRFHKYNFLTGGSDYEFAISPFYMRRLLKKKAFSMIESFVVTFSHPRFPIFLQKMVNIFDDRFSKLYLAGLINLYSAVKQ